MSAYQEFIDFFSMRNKQRLDGLSQGCFDAMTVDERQKAFDYLWSLVAGGGTGDSVNGLFRADSNRARQNIMPLLKAGVLAGEAQIMAAWNISQMNDPAEYLPLFIRFMSSSSSELRGLAAYYVPSVASSKELVGALQGMIQTEAEQLPRIHAVDKLLKISKISEESVGKKTYLKIFRQLHGNDMLGKEKAFKVIRDCCGANVRT